jgi:hypothetical protein
MAIFTDTWNSNFDAAPDGSTVAANTLDTVIATTKKAVRERFAVEHNLSLTNSADQGTHQAGSAVVYYQDEAPTTRPSGDDLDSDDAGRVWIDSDDKSANVYTGSDFSGITTGIVIANAGATTEGAIYDLLNAYSSSQYDTYYLCGNVTVGATNRLLTIATKTDSSTMTFFWRTVDNGGASATGSITTDTTTAITLNTDLKLFGICT